MDTGYTRSQLYAIVLLTGACLLAAGLIGCGPSEEDLAGGLWGYFVD